MKHLVVLTRPEAKNQPLASALLGQAKQELQVLSLPALRLQPFTYAELSEESQQVLLNMHQFDAVFCVSTQAAACFLDLWQSVAQTMANEEREYPPKLSFLCVGRATHDYLLQRGINAQDIISPYQGNDSEALLVTLEQQNYLKTWRNVLIARAESGRDWFQEQLLQRNIQVQTLSLYKRIPVVLEEPQKAFLKQLPDDTSVQWLFSSSESVKALIPQLYALGIFKRHRLLHHFWVIHHKIAQTLTEQLVQLSGGDITASSLKISLISPENEQISKTIYRHITTIG